MDSPTHPVWRPTEKVKEKKNYFFGFMMEIYLRKIKVNIALNKTWKLLPERNFLFYGLSGLKKKFVLFSDFAFQFFIFLPNKRQHDAATT